MTERRATWMLVALWAIAFACVLPRFAKNSVDVDFQSFYCGGKAMLADANPYLQEPLRQCERTVYLGNRADALVMPAPLPPYALVAFAQLARFSFVPAAMLWTAVLIVAFLLTVRELSALTHSSMFLVFVLVGMSDGVLSIALGQSVPIAMLGLVWVARALDRGRPIASAAALVLVMAQPQVGVPVALALMCASRTARLPAFVSLCALAALSAIAVGPQATLQYAITVLPLHAFAELPTVAQLSLSAVLYQMGVSANLALALGSLSYLTMLVIGVIVAATLSRRYGDASFLAFTPAAFVLLGGTFAHAQQYALAIPFGLLLMRFAPSRGAKIALALLAVPWLFVLDQTILVPLALVTIATIAWCWNVRSPLVLAALVASAAALFATAVHFEAGAATPGMLAYRSEPTAFAQYAWAAFQRTPGVNVSSLASWTARLLSVGSLFAVVWIGCRKPELQPDVH